METNAKQMKCGACGCETHRIFSTAPDRLLIECTECKCCTVVRPSIQTLDLKSGENSNGSLAIF